MSSWDAKAGLAQGQSPGLWGDWEGGCGFDQPSIVLGGGGSVPFRLLSQSVSGNLLSVEHK